jgi:hypothetical protein
MNLISIIHFIVVGLNVATDGTVSALIEQRGLPGSIHEVRRAPSYWHLNDTIRVSTYMVEDSLGRRFETDTLIIAGGAQ